MSRNDGRHAVGLLNLILVGFLHVVAEIHAFNVDIGIGGVVEFNPVVTLEEVVDEDAVGSAYLVDSDGSDAILAEFLFGEWGEGGDECVTAFGQGDLSFGAEDGVVPLPSCKAIAGWRFCSQQDRGKQLTLEVGVGHIDSVHIEAGTLGVGFQADGLYGDIAEFRVGEILQVTSHLSGTSFQLILNRGGRTIGVVAIVDALLLHQLAHGFHVVQQLIDNLARAGRLEHTSCYNAERVDEPTAELIMSH